MKLVPPPQCSATGPVTVCRHSLPASPAGERQRQILYSEAISRRRLLCGSRRHLKFGWQRYNLLLDILLQRRRNDLGNFVDSLCWKRDGLRGDGSCEGEVSFADQQSRSAFHSNRLASHLRVRDARLFCVSLTVRVSFGVTFCERTLQVPW